MFDYIFEAMTTTITKDEKEGFLSGFLSDGYSESYRPAMLAFARYITLETISKLLCINKDDLFREYNEWVKRQPK